MGDNWNDSSTSATNDAADDLNQKVLEIAQTFILICSPFAIIFNIFVIYLAMKFINFKVRLEQIFVLNMTLSDLLFGIVYLTTITVNVYCPRWLCRPYYAIVWITSIASVMFLLLLNIHKVITLFFPLKAMMFMSRRKIIAQAIACWAVWILLCTIFVYRPTFVVKNYAKYPTVTCAVSVDFGFYIGMIILAYITPLTLSLIISICIFGLVQKKGRRSKSTSKERRRLFKRILFVFVSTFWTALTSLPYRLTMFKVMLCRYEYARYNWWSSADNAVGASKSEKIIDRLFLINNTSFIRDNNNYTTTSSYNNGVTFNSTSARANDGDYCTKGTINIVLQVFLCITTLGCVINPLITISTQSKYVKGAQTVWRSIKTCKCFKNPKKRGYLSGQLTNNNGKTKKKFLNNCTAELTEIVDDNTEC